MSRVIWGSMRGPIAWRAHDLTVDVEADGVITLTPFTTNNLEIGGKVRARWFYHAWCRMTPRSSMNSRDEA
jgi:hypothetical protein